MFFIQRSFLFFLTTAVFASTAMAWDGTILPKKFTLNERYFAFMSTFDLKGPEGSLGTVTKKLTLVTTVYTYADAEGKAQATAKSRLLSWGTHIDVFDAHERLIGTIKEKIFKSLFKTWTVYSIQDADGKEVAESEKIEFLGTRFTLSDRAGRPIATLERPYLNLVSDRWTLSTLDPKAIDSRLLVMIGAYKTSADNARR